jgi:hypothetical protein
MQVVERKYMLILVLDRISSGVSHGMSPNHVADAGVGEDDAGG